MKTLGIIIPAYNAASSLDRLMKSLIDQMTDDVLVLIVDDGSMDSTLDIARHYENDAISVIHQENKGVGAARNKGIDECDARFLWFVDADDELMPNSIATLLDALGKHPSDCYLFGFEKIYKHRAKTISNGVDISLGSQEEICSAFDYVFSSNLFNPLWNKIFSKKIINENSIRFSDLHSGEDAEFVLHFIEHVDNMYVMKDVLYGYVVMSATSSSRVYQDTFFRDRMHMIAALNQYRAKVGVDATCLRERWAKDIISGYFLNIYNLNKDNRKYRSFHRVTKDHEMELQNILTELGGVESGIQVKIRKNTFFSYTLIRTRTRIASIISFFQEVRSNPGLLPKLLVAVMRYGMWAERIPNRIVAFPFKLTYRVIDVLYCKLLLNCDIPAKTTIGKGVIFYHPYGIFINSQAVIGTHFICRGQVTIGNKGDMVGNECPVIGDYVQVGVGAKLIGPIKIGDHCSVGANAVVTHSFPSGQTIVGIPAHAV